MSLVINTEERVINLTLSSQQGPAGASTVAAQDAALAAQDSRLAAEQARTEAQGFRNESQTFSLQSLGYANDSSDFADNSALSATQSANSAAQALSTLGLVEGVKEFIRQNYYPEYSYDTYNSAREAVFSGLVPANSVVFIVNDERFLGARTFSKSNAVTSTFVLNFANNSYSTFEPLDFIAYAGVELVDVPPTSASFGFIGALAVNETHLYVHTGTVWKRIALESF